jgi:GNAT superfamily N-acetyltransferase
MIGRFTEKELIRAIETTYYEAITDLCTGVPGIFLRREPDMTIYSTGLPMALLNGVLGPKFNASNLSKRAEVAMSHFKDARLPMRWVLGPSSTPPELDGFLLRQGLVSELTTPGMAIDLRTVNRGPLPSGLEIRPVEDMESLENCCDISAEVFEVPEHIRGSWGDLIRSYGIGPTRRWFLGHLDGRPVSTSFLVLHGDVAGIYMVATLKEARGKGVGSAMTHEPLLPAKDAGYDVAVLEASELGLPVYERLGFRKLCEFRTFTWSP